ncbi:unnamed protein product [Linum trigynum]|uniref:ATP synthase subunit e, mitochondrial n=1 Tax=Linum trigynum TaxID=586398 RepID=A0AAV2EJI3_9ROSI
MAPPGPYSGGSSLALVARVSAFSVGLVYGSLKLKYLKVYFRCFCCSSQLELLELDIRAILLFCFRHSKDY